MFFKLICCCLAVSVTFAQDYQDFQSRPAPARLHTGGQSEINNKPTPIPILKQINRHNEDGSYTYGYEGADGSFKIETKLATGEVKGKYGYVDESSGKVRVVEYGANKYGFQPSGDGITVAPPTLVDESTDKNGQLIDYDDEPQQQQPQPLPKYRPQPKQHRPQAVAPQPQYHYEQQPQQQQQPQYVPEPQFPNADVVYASRPRPVRPEPEYRSQQQQPSFLSSPQVQEPIYESPIARSYPRPQSQPLQSSYQAPRAGSHLAQLARQNQPQPQYQPQTQELQQPQQQQQQQQQHYAPRPTAPIQGRSTSVLDQLAKDFALPQGGSPALHDITYSYY